MLLRLQDEKNGAFAQIVPETLSLCTDVFGNYVIQKFFEYGTAEHRKQLIGKILNNVLLLSMQMYGCRVVQKVRGARYLHLVMVPCTQPYCREQR